MLGGRNLTPDEISEFIWINRWVSAMKHRVAVRAYGSKVLDRFHLIGIAYLTDRHDVMDVDEAGPDLAIDGFEVKAADQALGAMVRDAQVSSTAIALVAIHEDLSTLTLVELGSRRVLISEHGDVGSAVIAEHPIDSYRPLNCPIRYRTPHSSKDERGAVLSPIEDENPIVIRN